MKITDNTKFLIVGLGVIGGSYAKALSRHGFHVRCITLEQNDIDYAKEHKMIEYGSTTVEKELLEWADIIVFALYPHTFIDWIKEYQGLLRSGTLITDVTGVKSGIVSAVQSILRDDVEFISAHPMAGRERSGVEYSDDTVFKGANYIVTPTEKNTPEAIEICKQLGELLGFFRISELEPAEHDKMIAFLSQLTHCIAVTLMNCNHSENLEKYTGDSFRDLTRIAKINDKMWSELFLWNKDALLHEMDAFADELKNFRDMLQSEDVEGMREKMRRSSELRSKFDKPDVNERK